MDTDHQLTVRMEPFSGLWPRVQAMAADHYREVGVTPDVPLDVQADTYLALEAQDMLYCFSALVDGVLCGYCAMIRSVNRKTGQPVAQEDAIFIAKAFRGIGAQFMKVIDDKLAALGVKRVYRGCKVDHDHGPVLRRLGYLPEETIYSRRLDPAPV